MNIKPVFTLTIDEFTTLIKSIVKQTVKEELKECKSEVEAEVYFNISELANFLHCTKATIHNYKQKGLPFYKTGRKLVFEKTAVLNFMKGIKGRKRVN